MRRKRLKIKDSIPAAYDLDQSEYQYSLSKRGRSTSFVVKGKGAEQETFVPVSTIGKGAFGRVRLFRSQQNNKHMFAVKNVLPPDDDAPATQAEVDGKVRASLREIDYLARVNPDLNPYLLKHFIDEAGNYDHRLLMPYIPGNTLMDFSITFISTAAEFALLMLKAAQAVARVHQLGLYHGDVRDGNFIISFADVKEFGMRSFTVRMIDFDHGGEIGKRWSDGIAGALSSFELILDDLNEESDVSDLRAWMLLCKNDLYITIPTAERNLNKYFPAFRQFLNTPIGKYVPVRALHDFINHMTANLQDWEQANNMKISDKKRAGSQLNLFAEKPQEIKADDLIAQEFEINSLVL